MAEKPAEVTDRVWEDFQRLRREKRAPLTVTALEGIEREAEKAKVDLQTALACCCENGWQGFKASWYATSYPTGATGRQPRETDYARSMREKVEQVAPGIAARAPGQQPQHAVDFFDVEAREVAAGLPAPGATS